MLRRLLTPKLLLAHVVVLVAVVVMVNLGFWQLRRLDQARSFNERLEQRSAAAPVTADELATGDPDAMAFRHATVTGTYVTEEELLHLARAHRGRSGNHVLTPLVTDTGLVVLVDRGWVPAQLDTPPVAEAAPPPGEVTVTGQLFESQEYASFGSRDRPEGELDRVLRVNLPRLAQQLPDDLGTRLAPVYLQLRSQEPAPSGQFPIPAQVPQLDDGPHLSYAVQWFLFGATALVAYALFLRKHLTGATAGADDEDTRHRSTHTSASSRP